MAIDIFFEHGNKISENFEIINLYIDKFNLQGGNKILENLLSNNNEEVLFFNISNFLNFNINYL
jgi:hypothetical protein